MNCSDPPARQPASRRSWGLITLLAAAVTALVLPRVAATHIPGSPSVAPTADAPAVGSCLTQNPAVVLTTDVRGVDGLSAPDTGLCSTAHYGEIVALVLDGAQFPHSVINQLSSIDVSYCTVQAETYLGLSPQQSATGTPGQSDVGFALWYPAQRGRVLLLGPSPRQQELGQTWVACAIYGAGAYQGSVHNVFTGHPMPPQFAICRADLATSDDAPCNRPHSVELFATASLTGKQINLGALTRTCRSMVDTITKIPDPTGGGRLQVVASVSHTDLAGRQQPGPPDPGQREAASAVCAVSVNGPGHLTTTLFGWGPRPLPLS